MIEPRKKDIGRRVRPFDDRGGVEGTVTGFDIHLVFVRYGDQHTTSKGKRREDLIWADEAAA